MKLEVIVFLTIISTIQNISYSQVGPFYPFEANARGVSPAILGFIVGSFSISYIVSAVVSGKYLSKIGKATGLKFGMMLIVVQLYGLGALKYVESSIAFVALSVLAQSIGGIGAGINTTCGIAIITNLFPEDREFNIGIFEAGAGFGLLLGPLIGTALYTAGGYIAPFWFIRTICVLLIPLL